MFENELLYEILADDEVRKCPLGTQSTIIHAMERILKKRVEVNPYVYLSDLFQQSDDE